MNTKYFTYCWFGCFFNRYRDMIRYILKIICNTAWIRRYISSTLALHVYNEERTYLYSVLSLNYSMLYLRAGHDMPCDLPVYFTMHLI